MNSVIREDINSIINSFSNWEFFRNKTILITGAAGFLPAYLVDTFLSLPENFNIKIIGLVRNIPKAEIRFKHWQNNSKLIIIKHDVSEKFEFSEKIDIIIHAASQSSPKYYSIDPVGTINANV